MPRLSYISPAPVDAPDVANRLQAQALLTTGPVNRTQVSSQVHTTAVTTYAPKTYIDTQDQLYALPSYYQGRDALNAPLSTRGAANGAATLDGSGKIPPAQIPAMGAGYLKGPFGPTQVFAVSGVGTTPAKIADFNIGVQSITFRPMCFASVFASEIAHGRPVIEARISSGSAAYADQTLIARGVGRAYYNGAQAVTVLPASATAVSGDPGLAGSMNIWVSLWAYELTGASTVSVTSNAIASAVVLLLRTAE